MRTFKYFMITLFLSISLISCNDGESKNLTYIPTNQVSAVIQEVGVLNDFEIEFKFKNNYDLDIDELYIAYCVEDSTGRVLTNRRNGLRVHQVGFYNDFQSGKEYRITNPYRFRNPYSYKVRILEVAVEFDN